MQGIVDGWVSGVIESNPRFGPLAFQARGLLRRHRRPGHDHLGPEYDADNAKADLDNAY